MTQRPDPTDAAPGPSPSTLVSRRQVLRGMGATASAFAIGAVPLRAGAGAGASGSAGPYSLETPYFALKGTDGAVTSLAFSPDGSGHYGENLLVAPGLYFQFLSDGAQVIATSPETKVTSTTESLTLNIPVYNYNVVSQLRFSNGYDIVDGGGAGQTFVAPDVVLSQLGLNLFSATGHTRPTANLSVSILEGGPTGSEVFAAIVTPSDLAQLSGGALLTYIPLNALELTSGATYFIKLETSDATWAVQYQDSADYSGGEFYGFGGLNPQPGKEMTFVLESLTGVLEYQATWKISLSGPYLSSSIAVTPTDTHVVTKAGFELTTAWMFSGYDSTDPATAPFMNFFDSEGEFLPIQEFKRRPGMWGEFSFDIGAGSNYVEAGTRKWIHCSGQRGYDLEFAWPDIVCHFAMAADAMTYKFYQSGYAPSTTLSKTVAANSTIAFPFNVTVSPQTGEVPEWYPQFASSNTLVDTYMSNFYWDRAFGWLRGAYGTDWLDWEGLALDWQGGPQREGQRILIEAITQDPDGYVWTWNPAGAESWPFPGPPYDSRHFTTNGMYILGIAHYYAWTGDRAFLAKMLPKAELAMEYYVEVLGGSSGLVTVDRGEVGTTGRPTHTGEDGAPGTNYWDLISYGWKDAYVNLYFFGALDALADLEFAAGNRSAGQRMLALRNKVRQSYISTFWTPVELPDGRKGGRFIQTIDERGLRHDHGATYLNLEAMRFGLPSRSQGRMILDWLDSGSTELTSNIIYLPGSGSGITIPAGGTLVQTFTAPGQFTHVAPQVSTNGVSNDSSEMTVSLYEGAYPNGSIVASERYVGVYNGWYASLAVPLQQAGTYYLEISNTVGPIVWEATNSTNPNGVVYQDGKVLASPSALSLVVVSPHELGPEDIYSRWGWAPRTTTRKNNFNYLWLWAGFTVPWGAQLEDGGADLYEVGFDVMARARYSTADDAFSKMEAVLQRYSLPDRLCGGPPLYLGEEPEDELQAGAVGVDIPFPESGLAPASFLYAFIGLQATPTRLSVRPRLPGAIDWVSVTNVAYRGRTLGIKVDRQHVEVTGWSKNTVRYAYGPGEEIVLDQSAEA